MAFAFIQSRSTNTTDPVVFNYASIVTAGSLLVACTFWQSSTATMSVSDNINGAWTAIGSPKVGLDTLSGFSLQSFYKLNAGTGGTTTVTSDVSGGSGTFTGLCILEYSVGTAPAALDANVYDAVNSPGTNPFVSSAITTTQSGDLLIYCDVYQNAYAGPLTIGGSSGVARETTNWGGNVVGDVVAGGVAGSKTGAATAAGAGEDQLTHLLSFKEGGGAGPSPAAGDNPPIGLLGRGAGW